MPEYSDYQNLLMTTNFVGGAGADVLPEISGDDRTVVTQSDGKWQFYYMMLSNETDLDNLSYYDSGDREYTELPSGADPSLSTIQVYIVQNVLHTGLTDAYSVTFEDVANLQFNVNQWKITCN